ncbi:MAG: T9SS type A sorting domain-containing protein, partial [Lentimicrobiaceae bacterium]|nr:T9SS type A sorting domain-containing protein [Lentimicrobiaceae bacterium]
IMDLSGRLLHSGMLQPAQASHRIGLPPLPSGVYLLQVSSKDGRAFCEKLVVTRP